MIDFEDLITDGYGGSAHVQVSDQYANMGITFNDPIAIDFSKNMVIPGLAHSGSKAIEQCYIGFCYKPIDIKFDPAVSSVGVWAGYHTSASGGFSQPREIDLIAYDANDLEIRRSTIILNPRAGPMPINIQLNVQSLAANISHAQVTFKSDKSRSADNRGLVLDDIEFLRNADNRTAEIVNDSSVLPLMMSVPKDMSPAYIFTSEALLESVDDANSWLVEGNEHYSHKNPDYKKALVCYEEAIEELDRSSADLWYSKGNALLKLKKYEDALKAYDNATNLDPNNKNAWGMKCEILKALNPAEAESACSKTT